MLSNQYVREQAHALAAVVVAMLAEGEYAMVERVTGGRLLSADELRRGVVSLGADLVETSRWVLQRLEPVQSGEGARTVYDVTVPLFVGDRPSTTALTIRLLPNAYGTVDLAIAGFGPYPTNLVRHPPEEVPSGRESGLPVGGIGGGGARSDDPVPQRWRPALAEIVHRLVIGDYGGLAADGFVSSTSDPRDMSIGRWIEDYPARLVDLPEEAWNYSGYGENAGEPGCWWVVVDLWTAEEGRSDLTFEGRVWDDGTRIVAKVDIVHVM